MGVGTNETSKDPGGRPVDESDPSTQAKYSHRLPCVWADTRKILEIFNRRWNPPAELSDDPTGRAPKHHCSLGQSQLCDKGEDGARRECCQATRRWRFDDEAAVDPINILGSRPLQQDLCDEVVVRASGPAPRKGTTPTLTEPIQESPSDRRLADALQSLHH